jgi:3-isopropylmalate/(R)-2-methylmalate dehydratase large subunit
MRIAVTATTMFDKIWGRHLVETLDDGADLIYVDLHLVQEVSSPQAFEGLRLAAREVRRPDLTLAVMDHNIPTTDRSGPITDELSKRQVGALRRNAEEAGVPLYDINDSRQGIAHIVAPERGLTQPGMTIVCGDSHTSTHGAFGAVAFGIGTSEVEQVLATQCIRQVRPRTMSIEVDGVLGEGVTAKDLILSIIAQTGVAGAIGHTIEYRGSTVAGLSMEERMTVCNMSIEAGARAGMIAPDDTTFDYLAGRPAAPRGADWESALIDWRGLSTDPDAIFDQSITIAADAVEPTVTWGTTPAMSAAIGGHVPRAEDADDPESARRALEYMALKGGEALVDIPIDRVFIGSCTNARISDLRDAAQMIGGRQVHPRVRAMVVPGSYPVMRQAEAEGLDRVFRDAGFEWREPGCSMCVAMNDDVLAEGERCASTSNRNFEGRQGAGGRTHLASPAMAAAAAVHGHFVDIREEKV